MSYTVAIVGRPNVGKSTLFNRIVGARKAITDDLSGVTRDRQYGMGEWNGKIFNLVDTGGFVPNSKDVFERAIKDQVKIAIQEANLLIFMVDVTTGITDLDEAMAMELRRTKKPVLVAVNKVDNSQRMYDANEFYGLGFEEMYFLSSMSGSGTGEILDAIAERIDVVEEEVENEIPRITIVGQPNVGKSTLLNALLGEERHIVTDIAGTTRDSIHTHYKLFGKEFLLVDTAGIRKKAKVNEDLEFYSVIRAIKAIDESDICILMVDANVGIEGQDMKIFQLIERKKKGVVILVNKWDAVEKDAQTHLDYEEKIKMKIAPFKDVPIIFISALEKQRIHKAVDVILEVFKNRQQKIQTSKLNELLLADIERTPPPAHRSEVIKIKYITQLPTVVPSFAFFCNYPDYVGTAYKNYLENKIRGHFNFSGVPINIFFRKK
ncbi:MAG: ribosome biogenesis GTPase Der [Bacteroidetes bacterium]|jgi:GTP-binding protein|nr:ribosome biogenesis GTPase Der [Bacteroidota bacterium]MBK7639807.1 ribosome biogenesis GTPase Der [Bacteroidota bacterium]MBK9636051.1 ribosome biogenesis GTPase Der [Bacteroidota bacterium]MBL0080634.1 ribosome biogenesis GTPase Der [Bacteroidota bacterium]